MTHWLILTVAASAGCVMLIVLLLGRIVHESGNARVSSRLSGAQTPLYWRSLSWAIAMLASQIGPLLTARTRLVARERLRQADLDRVLTPESYVAGQVLCALFACAAAALVWSRVGSCPGGLRSAQFCSAMCCQQAGCATESHRGDAQCCVICRFTWMC
jgi:hypothetical protein